MEYYKLSAVLLFLRILEIFSTFFLILAISGTKFNMKRILICSICMTILYETTRIITPKYLTSILSLILVVFFSITILKINYKKAIVSYIITSITLAIIDSLVSISILKIFNLSSFLELSQNTMLLTFGEILIIMCMLIISLIIKMRKKDSDLSNVKNSTNFITLIVTFLLLFPNLVMILYYHDNKPLPFGIIIINIVAIILTFLINIYNTQRGIKLVQAEEELITEKTYNNTLRELVDSLRTFKHDYNNTLQTIHGYIYTQDMNGLTEYFDQVLSETKTITGLDRLNPELFRNPSLFGLVTAKFESARKSGVTMNFEIYADLNDLDIKTYDFTRILGILLDNAIEASAGSKKKIVNFYVVEKNGKVTVEISNSFTDTGLKIDEINEKGKSSKGKNRGLGLYKVKDILSRYPKIVHETKISSDLFLQRLVIDKVRVAIK